MSMSLPTVHLFCSRKELHFPSAFESKPLGSRGFCRRHFENLKSLPNSDTCKYIKCSSLCLMIFLRLNRLQRYFPQQIKSATLFASDCHALRITGPYNFQSEMAVFNCAIRCHFRFQFASLGSLRVRLKVVRVFHVSYRH